MLGIIRIYYSWMSSFRNTTEDLYGCACTSFLSRFLGFTEGVEGMSLCWLQWIYRDQHNRRETRLIIIYRGCIQILLGLERRSEGRNANTKRGSDGWRMSLFWGGGQSSGSWGKLDWRLGLSIVLYNMCRIYGAVCTLGSRSIEWSSGRNCIGLETHQTTRAPCTLDTFKRGVTPWTRSILVPPSIYLWGK